VCNKNIRKSKCPCPPIYTAYTIYIEKSEQIYVICGSLPHTFEAFVAHIWHCFHYSRQFFLLTFESAKVCIIFETAKFFYGGAIFSTAFPSSPPLGLGGGGQHLPW
jgi:hypothetical protein